MKFPPDASEIYYVTWMVRQNMNNTNLCKFERFSFFDGAKHPVLESFTFFCRLRFDCEEKLSICFAEEENKKRP